jgi:hypothetical protein
LAGLADENYFQDFIKEAKQHMKTPFNLGSLITIKSIASLIKSHNLEELATMAANLKKNNSSFPFGSSVQKNKILESGIIVPPNVDVLKSLVAKQVNIMAGSGDYKPTDFAVTQTDSPMAFKIQCVSCFVGKLFSFLF